MPCPCSDTKSGPPLCDLIKEPVTKLLNAPTPEVMDRLSKIIKTNAAAQAKLKQIAKGRFVVRTKSDLVLNLWYKNQKNCCIFRDTYPDVKSYDGLQKKLPTYVSSINILL